MITPKIQGALGPLELKGVHTSVQGRAELVPSEVQWRGFVTTAAAKAQLSGKDLCYHLGIQKSQLSDQLAGKPHSHLSFWRCRCLPREFWVEFVVLIVAFYDITITADPQTARYAEIGRRHCELAALVGATGR